MKENPMSHCKHSRRRYGTKKHLAVERLELRQLLAADFHPGHNFFDPEDVNDDGNITPIDALIVVNEMNNPGVVPGPGTGPVALHGRE